jgi:hypothetical protein
MLLYVLYNHRVSHLEDLVDYVWWYLAICRGKVFPLHTNAMLKVKNLSPFLTSSPVR